MSRDMVYEDVPRLSRRQGDNLIAGQNNATILLGRDRMGPIDSGYGVRTGGGKSAGAIHAVVGRKGEDPSVEDDASTLYLSQKTDPDRQAGTSGVGKSDQLGRSGAILRADCVRIAPRVDFKISVGKAYVTIDRGGEIVIEGDIQLGENASERAVLGSTYRSSEASLHSTMVTAFGALAAMSSALAAFPPIVAASAVATACGTGATGATAAANALSSFEASTEAYLSRSVRLK